MKKINILFLIDTIYGVGGTEKHLSQLVSYLDKERFSCSIVTFWIGKDIDSFLKKIENHNVYFEHIPLKKFYDFNGFKQALRIRKLIKEKKIDIVQTFHCTSDTYGVLVAKLSGVSRVISSRRDTGELKKSHHIKFNKLVNPLITQLSAVSNVIADQTSVRENIPRNKILTIYNGVEMPEEDSGEMRNAIREEMGISDDDFVVGSVAHMRPEKGYDVFLKAIKRISSDIRNLKAIVVGRVFDYPEIIRKMGLENNIILTGNTDRVREYISAMDIACLTAVRNEGMSNAILEEMAMGKPVIATTIGGSPEVVVDSETGYLVPPGDIDKLSDAIMKLYRDRTLLEGMGKKGRERIKQEFSIEKMINRIEKLYDDVYRQAK